MKLLLQLVLFHYLVISGLSSTNELKLVSDCVCHDKPVIFQCSVNDCGCLIAWSEDVIEQTCGGLTTDIILETGPLMEIGSSTSNSCNSRRANATVIKGVNGTCVSHLTVFADPDLDGALVQCSVDNCNGMEIIELNNTLKLSRNTDSFQPPKDVELTTVERGMLQFNWTSTLSQCPQINYTIEAEYCELLYDDLQSPSVICQNFPIPTELSLSIRTVVCDNIFSNESSTLNVSIRVPAAVNVVDNIAYYNQNNSRLTGLQTRFHAVPSLRITDNYNATTFYTITLTSNNGNTIDSVNIPSCQDEICEHEFRFPPNDALSDVQATFIGVNVFGNGTSHVANIKGVNNFVTVTFQQNQKALLCTFLDPFKSDSQSCIASVYSGDKCQDYVGLFNSTAADSNVQIIELSIKRNTSCYCYSVLANNGTMSLIIEGSFIIPAGHNVGLIAGLTVAAVIILLITVTAVLSIILCFVKRYQANVAKEDVDSSSKQIRHLCVTENQHNCKKITKELKDITSTCNLHNVPRSMLLAEFVTTTPELTNNYKILSGCGYFEFTRNEYIPPESQIILMNQNGEFFTGPGARQFVGVDEDYNDKVEVQPPDPGSSEWIKVFVQTKLYNKMLHQGTSFLYNCEIYELFDKKHQVFAIKEECTAADLAKSVIPGYRPSSGLGYYEFKEPEHINPTSQILIMDKDGKLYTGHGPRYFIGADENRYNDSIKLQPPNLENTQWKHVFIQVTTFSRKIRKGTMFLYCGVELKPLNNRRYCVKMYEVKHDCEAAAFMKDNVPNYKLESGYYQFTKPEYILHDTEVVLMDKEDVYFKVNSCELRQELGISGSDESQMVDPSLLAKTNWKHAFLQTKDHTKNLLRGTKFLYCRPSLTKMPSSIIEAHLIKDPSSSTTVVEVMKRKVSASLGYGYHEFVKPEFISPNTKVVLEDKNGCYYTGAGARHFIGAGEGYDDRVTLRPPNLCGTDWEKVYIQSRSYDKKLESNTTYLYINEESFEEAEGHCIYEVKEDTSIVDFTRRIDNYKVKSGFGFYEFVDPEFVEIDKRVMLMDVDERVFTGPGARQFIGASEGYDENKRICPPDLKGTKWKHVFLQSRAYQRKLKKGTKFLYCDTFMERLDRHTNPYDVYEVTAASVVINFMLEKDPKYRPTNGRGYYELTKPEFVSPEKHVLLLHENGSLYTGPGARHFIGAGVRYDDTKQIHPPNLSDTKWKGVFLQSTSYHRELKEGTKFLYFRGETQQNTVD